MFQKAQQHHLAAIAAIYDGIHGAEERGEVVLGWKRNVYPTERTAAAALAAGDLYVALDDSGAVAACARINHSQLDVYEEGDWAFPAKEDEVLILHTLTVAPHLLRRGYGKKFVAFYEEQARAWGCRCLRLDTHAENTAARALYRKLGYAERGIVLCHFDGLDDAPLVLFEKILW